MKKRLLIMATIVAIAVAACINPVNVNCVQTSGIPRANRITIPGGETGSVSQWTGSGTVGNARIHTGGWALLLKRNTRLEQVITGLVANTRYTLSGWLYVDGKDSIVRMGAKNFGSIVEVSVTSDNTGEQKTLTFTTGAGVTSATVYLSSGTEGYNWCYGNDLYLDVSGGSTALPTPAATASSRPSHTPSGYVAVYKIRVYPRSGYASRIQNGRIEGSNESETNGFTSLYTIASVPANNAWTEYTFTNSTVYRYVKYYSPANSYGNIGEIEFYNGTTKLWGRVFGTTGGNGFATAMDGSTSTYWNASLANDNYVGIDLSRPEFFAAAPAFNPAAGSYSAAQNVAITTSTSGASIRYTTDGTTTSSSAGTLYSSAVAISSSKTLKAVAYKSGMWPSSVTTGVYNIGGTVISGLKTYHIGNSLTDTLNSWLDPVCDSAGYNHTYIRSTNPGASIEWNRDHPGSANGDADYRTVFSTKAPLGLVAVQVFPNPMGFSHDIKANNFYDLAKQKSPNARMYLYMSWPSSDGKSNNYNSAPWTTPAWTAPYPRPTRALPERGQLRAGRGQHQGL